MQRAEMWVCNSAFRIVTTQDSKHQIPSTPRACQSWKMGPRIPGFLWKLLFFHFPPKCQLRMQALPVGKVWRDSTDSPPLLPQTQPPKTDSMPLISDFPTLWSCSEGASEGWPTSNSPTTQNEEHTTHSGELSFPNHGHSLVTPLPWSPFKIPTFLFKSTSFVGSWLLLHWDSLIQSCVLFSGGMPHVFIFQSLISANSSISARSKVVLLFRSAIFFPKWTKWKFMHSAI